VCRNSSVQEGVHGHRNSGMVASTRSRARVNLLRTIGDRATKVQRRRRGQRKAPWNGARENRRTKGERAAGAGGGRWSMVLWTCIQLKADVSICIWFRNAAQDARLVKTRADRSTGAKMGKVPDSLSLSTLLWRPDPRAQGACTWSCRVQPADCLTGL
jgi:hypothetical protein